MIDVSDELSVLILEDHDYDAELIVRALRQAGVRAQCRFAATEQDFLAHLSDPNDVILSDYTLPGFSGLDALRAVRARGLDTPFILVSGSIGEEIAVAAMREGADDYVLKDRPARLAPAVLQALEKRRLQREHKLVQASLQESEARFRQIAENIREVFWLADIESRELLYVSPGFELVWGRSRADLRASPGLWLDAIHEDEREAVRAAWQRQHVPGGYDLQYRVIRPDGTVRWVHDRAFPVADANGTPYRVAGVAEDITERRQAETRIHGLNRVYAMLSGINNVIVRVSDRHELYEAACRIAVEHGRFGIAWIGELDSPGYQVIPVAAAGLDASPVLGRSPVPLNPDAAAGGGIVPHAVRERRPVFENDIAARPHVGGHRRAEAIRRGYRSAIALPLMSEGTIVATFSLFAAERGFFDAEEVRLLTELAANISYALDHLAHERRLEKLSRVRMVSSGINAAIVRIGDRTSLLRETCRIASQHGRFPLVWVAEIDADRRFVRCVDYAGFEEADTALAWDELAGGSHVLSLACRTGERAVCEDSAADAARCPLIRAAVRAGCLSAVCLPLRVEGKVVAMLALFASGHGFFDAEELALLDEVAADVSFALQSIAQREKVEYLSYYDSLTGLPNRRLFTDRAQHQMRARGGEQLIVALVLLNIERFRNINETFGRRGGDRLLTLIAQRLEGALGGKEHLARVGADGFGILIRGMRDSADVVHAIEQTVLSCFDAPFNINETDVLVAAKAGIALFPTDAAQADVLLNNAEAALKRARTTSEKYLFYSADMNARAAQLLSLETRLRAAVSQEQLVLHYQPKFELTSGRICGLEALMRWQDPEKGLVPPGAFIPLLEETGLILQAGAWALRQAVADYRAWQARGLAPPRVAVNVSAVQLRRSDFTATVIDALRAQSDAPEILELEITESLLVQDVGASSRALSELRGMGLKVAMDDFGTGYSSLSYIARLPIDSVKIDRSFVQAMIGSKQDMSVVATILALARTLSLRVVAEGVETEEQFRTLKALHCDEAQGYFFSKPVSFEAIASLLARQRDSQATGIG